MSILHLQTSDHLQVDHGDPCSSQILWDHEYEEADTIPSSHRAAPAHALVELARKVDIDAGNALDLGCGNGRNSFFLAEKGVDVTAVDFSRFALKLLSEGKSRTALPGSITPINHDLRRGIPSADKTFDLVLDAYCLCHFTEADDQKYIMGEVARVLKSGGYFIKIHLDTSDAYYLERFHTAQDYGYVSFDPANGLKKMHCSLDSYVEKVATDFALLKSVAVKFLDHVRGAPYERSVFACLMQKI